jgi:hypothetical protein
MKKAYDVEAGVLTFTSEDGSVQTLQVASLPETVRTQALFHGLSQKIGDSYSGAASQDDPEGYARECVKDTIAQLLEGNWRAAGGGGGPKYGQLVTALAEVTGKTLDEAKAIVEGLSDKERKEVQAKPKIKAAIAKLKLAKAMRDAEAAEKAAAAEEAGA